jgi:predicted Zn-dependent protease
VWVEEAAGLPGHVARGLEVWESQFIYGEYRGTVVSDSTEADVIVRSGSPPSSIVSRTRLHRAFAPECTGASDVDVDETNSRLQLPIRLYIDPGLLPDDPATRRCLALTSIHELGHAIGIFAHSPDSADIMFGDPVVELPSPLDRGTAETAYHTPPTLEAVRP